MWKFFVIVAAGFVLAVPLAAQRGRPVEASVESGHYRQAGLTYDVPPNWKYEGTVTGEGATDETAHWTDSQSGISLFVYHNQQMRGPEEISRLVSNAVAYKTQQRERQGYLQWRMCSDSIEPRSIGGHKAIFAIADFERRTSYDRQVTSAPVQTVQRQPRLEVLAWIYAPENSVLFFATLDPDQLTQFRPVFDRIVQSANLQ